MKFFEIIEKIEQEEVILYEDIKPYKKSLPFYLASYDPINTHVAYMNDSYGMSWIITTLDRLPILLLELGYYSVDEVEEDVYLDYVINLHDL